MENNLNELCPICIEKTAEYFTECNHSFCIDCLCKIKKCAMCRKFLLRSELCIAIKQKFELINVRILDNPFENLVQTRIPRNSNIRNRNRTNLMSTLYRINHPNSTSTLIRDLIDSAHYNNNEEEYDEFGRRIYPPDEYEPIISYYGQFPSDPIPSRIPRWQDDNMWQQTRDIYPENNWQIRRGMLTYTNSQNRIPRWGDPRH